MSLPTDFLKLTAVLLTLLLYGKTQEGKFVMQLQPAQFVKLAFILMQWKDCAIELCIAVVY